MFVRKKKNKSGSVSVQIIDKSRGYKVFKTVGSSSDPEKVKRLVAMAYNIINSSDGRQLKLLTFETKEDLAIKSFLSDLSNTQIHTIGPELIFGSLFDRIGFNALNSEMFRHIVIARLAYPASKLKTVDYLLRYRGINIEPDAVYRFLDRLHCHYKEKVERIAFEYTRKTLKTISVVFYDMTTLYFEAEDEDDLRKIGFSKDGKFQKPQIMLGLLVGQNGYPIGYNIFQGNTFEGHTLLPVLAEIQRKYGFDKPIVVADAALLSRDNLDKLSDGKYKFIIGARIKNETDKVREEILKNASGMKSGESFVVKKEGGIRIYVDNEGEKIPADQINRLFEPFVHNNPSGSGLGLWVTYQIIQQLNGEIAVDSREGHTRFTVDLPLDLAA